MHRTSLKYSIYAQKKISETLEQFLLVTNAISMNITETLQWKQNLHQYYQCKSYCMPLMLATFTQCFMNTHVQAMNLDDAELSDKGTRF